MAKAFLNLREGDAVASVAGARQVSIVALGRTVYAALDWSIAVGLGAMVVWMNSRGKSSLEIFVATWTYDFIAAYGFFLLSDLSGYDITLGRSIRRSVDVIMTKDNWLGIAIGSLALLGTSLKAMVWEGPEVICFLFKKEIGSNFRIFVAMIILSAGQGAFGAWLYTTGYNLWDKAKAILVAIPTMIESWFHLLVTGFNLLDRIF